MSCLSSFAFQISVQFLVGCVFVSFFFFDRPQSASVIGYKIMWKAMYLSVLFLISKQLVVMHRFPRVLCDVNYSRFSSTMEITYNI